MLPKKSKHKATVPYGHTRPLKLGSKTLKNSIQFGLYLDYIERAKPIILRHGGEYVVRSDKLSPVSGKWEAKRIILIRFASKRKLRDRRYLLTVS